MIAINEAFAAVGIASSRELGGDPERVNVNGGAIALGPPISMSGARIALTRARSAAAAARHRPLALCGGGQGDSLILRIPGVPTSPTRSQPHSRRTCMIQGV